ncbi:sugar O-acyltransferase, sialic acid O-acetyltransferase NeuD family [Rhizobiales bacterium GAS113]|nr:sugar O-acyltransferase, sialic acid O-acetyltransferase NeuD family [Rhizobiales bacterium GAS113]
MMDIVIFGAGEIAELARFYFTKDSAHGVAAFAVDAAYVRESTFCGLPVVAIEELPRHFPPATYAGFVALSYAQLNRLRAEKCAAMKAAGYALVSYVSSRATVFADLTHGENCFILEDNTIQPHARIGTNVTLWSGNHIGHHSVIEDNVFIASHVVVSGGVTVGANSFLGVNCTIRDHVKVGRRCVLGAGTLLLGDAEDESVYMGAATEKSRVPSNRLRRL